MKKRILSLCMAVLLLCSLLPQVALPARAKAPTTTASAEKI